MYRSKLSNTSGSAHALLDTTDNLYYFIGITNKQLIFVSHNNTSSFVSSDDRTVWKGINHTTNAITAFSSVEIVELQMNCGGVSGGGGTTSTG